MAEKTGPKKPQPDQSKLSIKTLDEYDPYEFRTDSMGHLSNFQAWVHLVKCSFGTGVLTMPAGFKHSGLIPGLVLGSLIGFFCVYCMHILIKAAVHIAARQRVPYLPFNQTMQYTFEHGFPLCKPLANFMKTFADVILVAYHFGICIAYINYMTQTLLTVLGRHESAEGHNLPTILSTLFLIPFVCVINCVRNLQHLAPVSMAGNIMTVISMGIIMYYIFEPTGHGFVSDSWNYVGRAQTLPLFIGIILFAVEAFGVIIAVEKDMKTPKDFGGWFGVFNIAMALVLAWYLFLGVVGYLRFGKDVKSTISLTIPDNHWSAKAMHAMVALSLFCSYPLHCYVCVEIIWINRILPRLKSQMIFWEIVFRCSAVVVSALCAMFIPQLDILVSLIGAVCLSFLGIMMPGIMDYNVSWSKYGQQWSIMMLKDLFIVIFGFLAFLIGTYGSFYGIVTRAMGSTDV